MKRFSLPLFVLLVVLVSITSFVADALAETSGYIVVFKDSVGSARAASEETARKVGGRIEFIYEHALKGFSINLPPQAAAALEKNFNVKYVVADTLRQIDTQNVPTGVRRIYADVNADIDIDGIDDKRIDVDVVVPRKKSTY